jgi:hypothetical protein
MDARTEIQSKLAIFTRLGSFRDRRNSLAGEDGGDSTSVIAATEFPGSIRSSFETSIEKLLRNWKFPGIGRVLFDLKSRDIEIDGKPRANNGKGVRAILHAAFSISLARFCADHSQAQPGFLVLDSPLLTYRDPLISSEAPDVGDDVVARSDLRERVLDDLKEWPDFLQLIIVENVDLPEWALKEANTTVFTGSSDLGRRGLY